MAKIKTIRGTTHQQKLFAYSYFNNKGNGTLAAIEAGYSKKTAAEQASRLLTNVKVKRILEQLSEKLEDKVLLTKERVLKEYEKIAMFDLRTLYDENNALKSISELSDEAGAAITGIEVLEEFAGSGQDKIHIGNTVKIKLNSKIAALDSIVDVMGWKAPTKTATTDTKGNDIAPYSDSQVNKILEEMRKKK